ncbi:hypothetical protein DES36_108113 [Alkalibaculum bacchi]|uniref:Uncharacterized protein n=1 Tax=Alkalibaculum bacchi TaxID=645887 RepID=A0A366I794_9FIRM|nr:hypothetical protein [Alkalibaculum bacchi]RBP64488.1 hypothetical protein DES36_108113 [Alkalibaculum bacchi]
MKGKQETNWTQVLNTHKNTSRESLGETENNFDDCRFNPEQKAIAQWLEDIHFQKQFFGGINEEDVWKKIGELNAMYEEALKVERIRYDTLLEHYKKICKITEFNGTHEEMLDREKVGNE